LIFIVTSSIFCFSLQATGCCTFTMSLCSFYDGPDRVPLRLCTDISGYFRNSYVEHYLCPTLRRPYGEGKAASLVKRVETRNQMVETLDQMV